MKRNAAIGFVTKQPMDWVGTELSGAAQLAAFVSGFGV
jgi:hypothetical protein